MFARVDNLPLVYLRIAVAIAIYAWADGFLADDKYLAIFVQPRFLFKYPHLEWISLWPGQGMYWHFVVTKIAAVAVAIGLLTRLSAAWLSFSIAYVLLVERQIYVNHYYLLSCTAGLLALLPSGGRLSIDSLVKHQLGLGTPRITMATWQLWLIRFQLGIPYFFGAMAKLNGDWLRGQPSQSILADRGYIPEVGTWDQWSESTQWWSVQTFAYGGFLFDLLIVPMLIFRPTRWLAVILSLCFHLTNAMTLTIGVFPWFMLATTLIFFPPEFLSRRWRIFLGDDRTVTENLTESAPPTTRWQRVGVVLAIAYVIIQLILPLRPAICAGDANWNERGHRFAWRMMLRDKESMLHFLVIDNQTGESLILPSTTVLTGYQSMRADHHPYLILETAKQLCVAAKQFGVGDPSIHVLALVSLNGRKPTLMIRPDVDLAALPKDAALADWFIDQPGPFLDPPWTIPKELWWQEIQLPAPFKGLQGRTPSELSEYLKARAES